MSDAELADFAVPDTDEKLHEKIKARMARDAKTSKYVAKIFDHMFAPDYVPIDRHQLAGKFGVLVDGHGFFYGLKWLKDNGYAETCDPKQYAGAIAKASLKTTAPTRRSSHQRRSARAPRSVRVASPSNCPTRPTLPLRKSPWKPRS